MAHDKLGGARKAKFDEFYTQYHDIEKEMNAYLEYEKNVFRDKTVLLPCDDPEWSNFTKYFAQNFERLGLKKLISTSYAPDSKPKELEQQHTPPATPPPNFDETKARANGKIYTLTRDTTGDRKINVEDLEWEYLKGDGDFRSAEVTALRDEADIVITNPPFSLFREFLAWIVSADKKLVIIGNMNSITYNEVFKLIKDGRLWVGATNFNTGMYFRVPDSFLYDESYKFERERDGVKVSRVPGVCWCTSLDHGLRHKPLSLMTQDDNIKFSKHKAVKGVGYKKYDNFDAIDVPFTDAIPSDYAGMMGVPISFLGKYNPDQFEIIGSFNNGEQGDEIGAVKVPILVQGKSLMWNGPVVAGEPQYKRIVIRHRRAA
jgi:hypothetical protein